MSTLRLARLVLRRRPASAGAAASAVIGSSPSLVEGCARARAGPPPGRHPEFVVSSAPAAPGKGARAGNRAEGGRREPPGAFARRRSRRSSLLLPALWTGGTAALIAKLCVPRTKTTVTPSPPPRRSARALCGRAFAARRRHGHGRVGLDARGHGAIFEEGADVVRLDLAAARAAVLFCFSPPTFGFARRCR